MATLDVLTLPEAKAAVKMVANSASDDDIKAWNTAVSLRLDELVGPVVRRAVTDELDGGHCALFLSQYPVQVVTSVTEYDRAGTAAVLAQETNAAKPAEGYRLKRYSADAALYGNEVARRRAGYWANFACGEGNVVVVYTAGRFADTASVDERFKSAARLMLKNVWRSEQIAAQSVGEYDVPQTNFPTYVISKAVRDLFPGELQGHYL